MKVICSFCTAVISPGRSPDDPVSHGVCTSCYNRILSSHGFNVRKFLDMLDAPVLLVDADVNIIAANALAIQTVRKPVSQIQGNLCGDVMECVNAFLPGGCGRTPECPDCTVRDSVNETYSTGHTVTRRSAIIRSRAGGRGKTMQLLISTQKDGDIVLLRLEPGEPV
jgi:hypothetical protein